MELKTVNPINDPLWKQLVEKANSSVFHSPEWISTIAKSYGWAPEANILLDTNGGPVGGFAYFLIEDFRGQRYISLPFSDYCDPLVDTHEGWEQLVAPLVEKGVPIRFRTLHNDLLENDERFSMTSRAKWHRIDVQDEVERQWDRIHSSARRAIRKASQNGATIQFRNDEDALKTFFNLHLGIRKYKYKLLPQPYEFFKEIWNHFLEPGRGTIGLAVVDDQIVGATMFLEWKDTLYYKFSASDLDQLIVRPTDLIIWEAMQHAHNKGLAYFDFGLSDWDQEGLLRFKRKYATEEKTISFFQHGGQSAPQPSIQQVNKLLGNLTGVLTDDSVPDEITAQAGALMYRFFI